MKMLPLFLALSSIAPAIAQSKSVYWPSSTIKGYSPALKSREAANKTATASEYLSDLGNYKFEILRRDASGGGKPTRTGRIFSLFRTVRPRFCTGERSRTPRTQAAGRFAAPDTLVENHRRFRQGIIL